MKQFSDMWIFLAFAELEKLPIFAAPMEDVVMEDVVMEDVVGNGSNGAVAQGSNKRFEKWYTHVVGAIVPTVAVPIGNICMPDHWNAIDWKGRYKAEIEIAIAEMSDGSGHGGNRTRIIDIPSWDGERLAAMHFQSFDCKVNFKWAYDRTIGQLCTAR